MRLIAHDLREVGINVDCAPVLDVADEATHARDRLSFLWPRSAARRRARVARRWRGSAPAASRRSSSTFPATAARASTAIWNCRWSQPAATNCNAISRRSGRCADAPVAMTAHVVYTAIDPEAPGDDLADGHRRDRARRHRLRWPAVQRRSLDEGARAARSAPARARRSPPASTSRSTATAISPRPAPSLKPRRRLRAARWRERRRWRGSRLPLQISMWRPRGRAWRRCSPRPKRN